MKSDPSDAHDARHAPRVERDGDDALLWIKAVPGASRDGIAGVVGERLKVRVAAPAEGGRANRAICAVVARALGAKPRDARIESGQGHPEKIVRVAGAAPDEVLARLAGKG